MISYRDLTTLGEFAAVVRLEAEIWGPGYTDVVPVPILAVTVHRGGILIGAFDGPSTGPGPSRAGSSDADRMIGFVYSLPGIKNGRPTQWSHMLGVVDEFRNAGVGLQLKLLQRDRALATGLDLIEWTYDPMQALNAHLNFAKLGVVAHEYVENVYGESASPLHKGNPTDRFVVEWWIREPRVEREIEGVPRVNRALPAGQWHECVDVRLDLDAPRVGVEIPMGFTEMLSRAPDLALAWRLSTRHLFTTYFALGYRAIAFSRDRQARTGTYVLASREASEGSARR